MAKTPKKKGSKGKPVAGPLAILYRLDAGTDRGDKVRSILSELGIRPKTVTVAKLGDSVGSLAGLTGMKPARVEYTGEAPTCEFMLLHGVPSALMNQLLAAMRSADVVVGCKAQVTQYNRLWPFVTLVKEVSAEHEAMTAATLSASAESADDGDMVEASEIADVSDGLGTATGLEGSSPE